MHWAPGATWADLQDLLLDGEWHVLHFIGHGDFDPTGMRRCWRWCASGPIDKAQKQMVCAQPRASLTRLSAAPSRQGECPFADDLAVRWVSHFG